MRSCCLVTVKANQKAKKPKPKSQKNQNQTNQKNQNQKKQKYQKKTNFPGLLEKPHRDFLRVPENWFFWCFWFFWFCFFWFFWFFWFWFFWFFWFWFFGFFWFWYFWFFLLSRVCDFSCILVYALGNTLYCTPSLLAVQLGDLRQGEKG